MVRLVGRWEGVGVGEVGSAERGARSCVWGVVDRRALSGASDEWGCWGGWERGWEWGGGGGVREVDC